MLAIQEWYINLKITCIYICTCNDLFFYGNILQWYLLLRVLKSITIIYVSLVSTSIFLLMSLYSGEYSFYQSNIWVFDWVLKKALNSPITILTKESIIWLRYFCQLAINWLMSSFENPIKYTNTKHPHSISIKKQKKT